MIFLPNRFELYCCALRNTIQLLIIKNGYKPEYLRNLMKIHIAEALFTNDEEPLEIKDFSSQILKAVFLKHIENNHIFRFKIKTEGSFLINSKLYASLLLTLCKSSEKIEISSYHGKLLIKSLSNEFENIEKHLKRFNATYFFERKQKILYILIIAPKTDKKPISNEKDWEYILNPLSIVNIYLN